MALSTIPDPVPLDPIVENEAKDLMTEHYAPVYKERVNEVIDTWFLTDHLASRYLYLQSVVGKGVFNAQYSILISGFAAGSEMIVARQFGFGKVYGVEVEQILTEACLIRLKYLPDMYPLHYDGDYLPYEDNQFNVIASGHVIEHTRDPELYLRECLRVLVPGGYLSLEFPNRYHTRELHTQLPSFEWLPRPIRNAIIRGLASERSPLQDNVKTRYRSIIDTNLQQISMSGIRRDLKRIGTPFTILDSVHVKVAPGVVRCVIQKGKP